MPTMFTLPWRWVDRGRTERPLLFASRFDATGPSMGWRLIWGGVRLRRAVLQSPGALGVSVRAHPLNGRYYTVSMWRDEQSLHAFAGGQRHQAAVRAISSHGPVSGVLLSRAAGGGDRPRWGDTLRWVDAAVPGPYRHTGSPALVD